MTEQPTLPAIRASLDQALAQLTRIADPDLPVADAERALGRGLQRVYAALARIGDHAEFRDQTQHAVDDVRVALGHLMQSPTEDETANRVSAAVAKCLGDLQRVRWALIDGLDLPREDRSKAYVRATHDLPRLLELRRDVIRPGVPLDEPPFVVEEPPPEVLPAPATQGEMKERTRALLERLGQGPGPVFDPEGEQDTLEIALDEEEESGPGRALPALEEAHEIRFGPRLTETELLRERAKDCIDELAMLGRMRRCTPLEPWDSGDETERRLLSRVDAVAACGVDGFNELVRLLDDRPIPDPEMTYANLFFHLCVSGDDTFDQAWRLLELAELEDQEMRAMCIDAFVFGPHPRTDAPARFWLKDPRPERRHFAMEVLRRRRKLRRQDLDLVAHDPHIPVLESLARSLPTVLDGPPPGALGWLVGHEDERVVRAALESALRLREPMGYSRALDLVAEGRGSWADAIVIVAIAGDESSRAPIEYELATACTPAALRAAGWFGEPSLVPFLLGRLEHGEPPEQGAALTALERITGASIIDASIVPEYAPRDMPFERERRTYKDPGLLDGTPEAWRAWWEAWGGGAKPGTRYRWGHRYTIEDTLDELVGDNHRYAARHDAAMELGVRGGHVVGLDRDDFVFQQHRELVQAAERIGDPRDITGWMKSLAPRP